ncbi:MAG: HlyD family efflux transporter periplasmic adaptor subunit [Candidatus Margulisiibacteriota bacterium]
MRRWSVIVMVGVVAFLIASCASKTTEKPLETAKVVRGNILAELPVSGTVIPRNRLEIKPPVAGRVEQVLVAEGQRVKKGAILAWMSSSERAAILDAARAKGPDEVKHWEDVYKPAPIVAPLDGFIIKRSIEPGQFIGISDSVLVMADRLIVEAQVDETDIGRIKVGQKSVVKLDAYPEQSISGHIEQIAYESETINNVTVYKVNVLPDSVPAFFRSGMSATVSFTLEERENVLTLPLTAIKKSNGQTYAFVRQDGAVTAVKVQTGLENNVHLELLSGLNEGAEVVIPTTKMVTELLDRRRGPQPFNFLGGGNNRTRSR